MKNLLILLAAFLLLFTAGCSSIPKTDSPSSQNIDSSDHWRARGKFSYRSEETKESGNFDWLQQGNNYQLRLFGPLGMGTVKISGNVNLVRIQTGDQDISSDQPLSLLYRMTGFKIPLNSMSNWLTGKPASLSPENLTLDSAQRITSFAEREWQLNYSNFKDFSGDDAEQNELPGTINAHKDDVHLRMVVRSWQPL